ncbi:MAG: SDR family oxidoreductase [Porticoccaceae bacterium]|nr:SDR family oxidoreductase [Porticoccaceae bacterium]
MSKTTSSTTVTRLSDRSALITGASRGIGFAIAEAFASEGSNIVLSASSELGLKKAKDKLDQYGVDVSYFVADVSDSRQIDNLFSFAIEQHSKLDILVNNAGIHISKSFTDHEMEEFDHLMKVNVHSVFQLTQLAIRHMQILGRGKVINVASVAGLRESMNSSAYNTSKHAVVGLTKCIALENAKNGINVNAICPGIVETDLIQGVEDKMKDAGMPAEEFRERIISQIPIGRMLQPQEIANIAVFLASSEADGMSGQAVTI